MSQIVNWLHISDFHFKAEVPYEQDLVLKKLLDFVKFRMEKQHRPDLIFATGDIGNTGSAKEYIEATKFFDELLKITKLGRDRLFVVPGNHDTDRKACKSLNPTLQSESAADDFFDGSPLLHITAKMTAFSNWYNTYFNEISSFSETSTCGLPRAVDIDGVVIAVLPVNTAVFSHGDQDQGKLWLGRRCLDQAIDNMANNDKCLRIALMHHPLEWLSEGEVSHIRSRLYQNFDCLLNGHLHRTDIQTVDGINGDALHLAAGAAYQGGKWPKRALLGCWDGKAVRVTPLTYVDDPTECWTIDTGVYPSSHDFSHSYNLPRFVNDNKLPNTTLALNADIRTVTASEAENAIYQSKKLFESELISTGSGQILFSEPRLMSVSQEVYVDKKGDVDQISIADIISSSENFIIECKSEYGGTTLSRKIHYELVSKENTYAQLEDCRKLSNYKSRLEQELKISKIDNSKNNVLILDNFHHELNDRLFQEIIKFKQYSRFIIIARNGTMRGTRLISPGTYPSSFKMVYLWAMSRSELRAVAANVFGYVNLDDVSEVVDKVYDDLLALRIPLTPSNVIMYLKILHRDNDFSPVNRTEIIGRYLVETLRRPSDILTDSFNAKSKIDFISSFIYYLYEKELEDFDNNVWNLYVKNYKLSKLIEFDGDRLLQELCESRIFVKYGSIFFLKYSFFFSYFIGHHITQKRELLDTFIEKKDYYVLNGVAEVISGLLSDNSSLMESLVADLEGFVTEFSDRYIANSYDPFLETIWEKKPEEEAKWWDELTTSIEDGPPSSKEIDVIKTNSLSEAKTTDQRVRFERLKRLEDDLFRTCKLLEVSLRNSNDTSGELKLRSLKAMFDCFLIGFQTGTMLAPVLSRNSIVIFGGAAFLNFDLIRSATEKDAQDKQEPASEGAILSQIVANLSLSISRVTADHLGLKKLIPLFNKYLEDISHVDGKYGFRDLILLRCVLQSKGKNWNIIIEKIINRTKRNAYYLHLMSISLMEDIQGNNVITTRERSEVKRLISIIKAKRDLRTEKPGSSAVSRVMGILEEKNYFDTERDL